MVVINDKRESVSAPGRRELRRERASPLGLVFSPKLSLPSLKALLAEPSLHRASHSLSSWRFREVERWVRL